MLMHGSRYFSTAVAQTIADGMGREALTPRESDVLDLLVDGHCNKAIAQSLAIAVGTVKAHVKAILEKLGARSRTHAVVVAAARGLILDAPDPEERIKLRRGHYSRNPMTSAAKSSGY